MKSELSSRNLANDVKEKVFNPSDDTLGSCVGITPSDSDLNIVSKINFNDHLTVTPSNERKTESESEIETHRDAKSFEKGFDYLFEGVATMDQAVLAKRKVKEKL